MTAKFTGVYPPVVVLIPSITQLDVVSFERAASTV